MFTNHAVIQKIDNTGNVIVYTADHESLNWTFEYRRNVSIHDNKDIFPFIITNDIKINSRHPGAETLCYKNDNEIIKFSDDYGVPAGFVICIISPTNYLPSMVKFKEKTNIPINRNQYSVENPGYIQIYSNRITKQSAVVIMTTNNCFFGFSVDFSPCVNEFPSNYKISASDTLEASVKLQNEDLKYITQQDISSICPQVSTDMQLELVKSINELIDLYKVNSADNDKLISIKNKIGTILTNIFSIGSGFITIADSALNHGMAYNLLQTLYSYFVK